MACSFLATINALLTFARHLYRSSFLGATTVLIPPISAFVISDWPDTVKFLNVEECKLLKTPILADTEGVTMNRVDKNVAQREFRDYDLLWA